MIALLRGELAYKSVDHVIIDTGGDDTYRTYAMSQGFAYVKTVEENDQMGTAFFRRAEGSPRPDPCS